MARGGRTTLTPNKHDWYEHEAGRYRCLKEEAPNPDWERAQTRIEKVRSGSLPSPRLRGEGQEFK